MTRELTIKIQLDDNAAYQTKTEAVIPVLGLLLECDEKNISYAVEEVKPKGQSVEVTVKGKVQLTVDVDMTFSSIEGTDYAQSALDILGDYQDVHILHMNEHHPQAPFCDIARFSNISFDAILSHTEYVTT